MINLGFSFRLRSQISWISLSFIRSTGSGLNSFGPSSTWGQRFFHASKDPKCHCKSSSKSKASHLKGFILLQHSKRPSACPTNPKNRKTKNHKKLKKTSTIRFQHLSTKTIPRRLNQNVGFLKQISSLGSSEAQGLRAGLSSPNDFCNGNALGSCGTWPKGLIHCV